MKYLFRAKSEKTGELIYGSLIERQYGYSIGYYQITGMTQSDPCGDTVWVQENILSETICQWSGLTDINAKYLFNGDIIRSFDSENNEIKHLIGWDDDKACFSCECLPRTPFNTVGGIRQSWINEFKKELIGNIFDNPELL